MKASDRTHHRHHEIAQRHRRRRKRPPDLSAIRIRELNRLLTGRHGVEELPDTPDVRRAIVIVAHHLAALPADPRKSITNWLELRAPWYSLGEMHDLIVDVIDQPRRWKAHSLGWQLKLSAADRKTLGIKTIGAFDVSPAERHELRKADARRRDRKTRRAKGVKPRAEYLTSQAAKSKPWIKAGVSRATYYRQMRRGDAK